MPDIVLNSVSDAVLAELGKRAANHHRSPVEEAKSILSDALLRPGANGWGDVDAVYHRLAGSGRKFGDSADLIREDRDR